MNWNRIKQLGGIVCTEGATESAIQSLPVKLPPAHLDFLRFTDGLTSGNGYFRVFGVSDKIRNQIRWNDRECWRFAWPNGARGFWFFAEIAHGAQFAYEFNEHGELYERVVSVGQNMIPSWTLPNFETFIENGVIGHPTDPIDPLFTPTLRKLGAIPANKHVVPVPHPCLGGDYASENIQLIDAQTAMIMNADLFTATSGEMPPHPQLEVYQDDKGRPRFRVIDATF